MIAFTTCGHHLPKNKKKKKKKNQCKTSNLVLVIFQLASHCLVYSKN